MAVKSNSRFTTFSQKVFVPFMTTWVINHIFTVSIKTFFENTMKRSLRGIAMKETIPHNSNGGLFISTSNSTIPAQND